MLFLWANVLFKAPGAIPQLVLSHLYCRCPAQLHGLEYEDESLSSLHFFTIDTSCLDLHVLLKIVINTLLGTSSQLSWTVRFGQLLYRKGTWEKLHVISEKHSSNRIQLEQSFMVFF